jgi:hypothetical protein
MCVIVGSGISAWSPTGIPEGRRITAQLSEWLVPNSMPSAILLKRLVAETAFEHILERCPNHGRVRDWLTDHFKGNGPNPVHIAIARLVSRGIIRHVITTNYDLALEQAFCLEGLFVTRIVSETDASSWDVDEPSLFKIHGSTDLPASLVFTLHHESLMASWKRHLLREMIRDRDLLVSGYSGTDFEICPELVACTPRLCIWNTLENPRSSVTALSANAQRVTESMRGIALAGDMRTLWTGLGANCDSATREHVASTVVDWLLDAMTEWERLLWRPELLVGIGCGAAAESCVRDILASPTMAGRHSGRLSATLGQALFHRGLYARAAREFRTASDWHSAHGELGNAVREKGREADALRCYGAWRRAGQVLSDAEALATRVGDEHGGGMVARQRALLTRHRFDIAKMTGRRRKAQWLRKQAIPLLRTAYKLAVHEGNWHDIQMCEMWADRMGIPLTEITEGEITPLRSRDGFGQLGYIVAVWMSLRDDVTAGRADMKTWDDIQVALADALAIGSSPESWKLAAVMVRGRKGKDFWRLIGTFTNSFMACEYTVLFRLFLLARLLGGHGV